MAYEGYDHWDPEFQDLWENMPADYQGMSREDYDWAQYMFEEGFQTRADDALPGAIQEAREEFYAVMGFGEDDFDWAGWREAMGYD